MSQYPFSKAESPKMFDQIAKRYDLTNRIISLGQDVSWRKKMISLLPDRSNLSVLDLATGTADVAIDLSQSEKVGKVIGIDLAEDMLAIGRIKIDKASLANKITLETQDAQNLSFDDQSFDVITISFGIRNLPDFMLGLKEMYRVCKPNGKIMILESSKPTNPLMLFGHLFYIRFVVPLMGLIFSGNYKAYRYLNKTIEDFPSGDLFCKIIAQVGFKNVKQIPLLCGAASLYVAEKLDD